ncbi:Trafficking protein particle complex subunit 11 [Phytophthora pseudosyringae]|uniref:Trafficking protein particle complex subunit 11 n=1 Tax=Phytophthora pseudosyringae TaxID=221518 RepID=A0A8T1WJG8_9STRA|nr:Trafficking protein particle complex subunit 11 [Phytophthora pseudosyringae]
MESFGAELKETPYPLVAALGSRELQAKVLPLVRAANEEFVPKLHLASLPREHRFPAKKELREKHGTFPNQTQRDFEGYRTQGVLKARWLKKHHELLPAVVLLFDEFDPRWGPQDWQQRETALREEVEKLKRTLSARECRVMLILMQQVDDAGVAPMNTTEERLANLRRRLDTDAKGLVLLRSRDLVRGSAVLAKLESSVRNMALEYYKAQSKRVKRYKKALAKTPGFQALHARLSFKIAHYYEFRRYTTKVLQHYEASYRAIIALPLSENESVDGIAYTQVMTIAESVNFKLCYHLIFSSSNIKGAVDQLQRHMGVYARAIIVADRAYEHWEWVSRQYHVFAQLLAEATSIRGSLPSTGLDSNVYKEPYLYYSIAAKYAMFRRKAAAKLGLTAATTVPTATPNGETISGRDFVVVPSVFVGGDPVVSAANAAAQDPSVAELVKYRHAMERTVPHAKRSIVLLEHAIQHLTIYVADHNAPRSRMKSRLLVHLGTERLVSGEYERSRAELQKAKATFAIENCWAQTAQILKQLLICTFRQGDTAAYLDYSLQLLSPVVEEFVSPKERGRIQDSFLSAWRNPAALGAPFTENSALGNGHELALDRSRPVFAVTAQFDRASACVKEDVTLELELRSHFPSPQVMSKIELVFNDERYRTVIYHQADIESGFLTSVDGKFFASLEFTHKVIKELQVPLRVLDGRQMLSIQEVRFYLDGGHSTQANSVDAEGAPPEKEFLIFSLLVERASVEQRETPQPYLVNGRVPAMGNGSASPSFSRRKSMFSLVEGPRPGHADTTEPIQENGTAHLRGSSLMILQPRAKATLSMLSREPLLTGDYRELAFKLSANEDTLENVTFQVACEPPPSSVSPDDAFFFTEQSGVLTPVTLDTNLQPRDLVSLPNKDPETEETLRVIVRSARATPVTLVVSVAYSTKAGVAVGFDERFELVCHDPFDIQGGLIHDFLSGGGISGAALMPKGSYGCVGNSVSFQGSVTCTSREPLRVLALEFEPRETNLVDDFAVSGFGSISPDRSSRDDVCAIFIDGDSRCFCLRLVPKVAATFVTLGRVKVVWRRESSTLSSAPDSSRNDVVSSWLEIPMVSFVDAPLTFSVETPPFGVEGVVVSMDVRVRNNEAVVHSLRVKPVDAEGAFFISGRTNTTEDLLPFDEQVFRWGLVPTKTGMLLVVCCNVSFCFIAGKLTAAFGPSVSTIGYLRLPRLEIVSLTYNLPFTSPDERQELFVLPWECPDWEPAP